MKGEIAVKKKYSLAAVLACICVGIWRILELLLNTNSDTGFIISGSLLLRYLILALPVAVIAVITALFKAKNKQEQDLQVVLVAFNAAAVGAAANGIAALIMFAIGKTGAAGAVIDIATAIGAVWLSVSIQRHKFSFAAAVLTSAALISAGVYAFLIGVSSIYRIAPVTELCACLFSALFSVYLLKSFAIEKKEKRTLRLLYFSGLLTFYFCCCLFLPQQIWGLFTASAQPYMAAKTMLFTPFGFLGLISALYSDEIAAFGTANKNDAAEIENENGDKDETAPLPENLQAAKQE